MKLKVVHLRISHDQLYNVIQLGYHLQDFLKELTIFPDLCCIVAVDDILNDFNKALIVKSDEPLLVSYDTTFDLGDFFVSVLVYNIYSNYAAQIWKNGKFF
jgi:hypothetical protein